MWGVIYTVGQVHIAPINLIDGDGFLDDAHCLGRECNCRPRVEKTMSGQDLVIHEELK